MTNTNKLLDKYKIVCGITSDNAAAGSLRLNRATISGWRHEKSHANAEAVEQMCVAIGEPLRHWLPLIEAERARTPADRRVWLRLAQAAAAVALTISFGRLDVQAARAHNPDCAAHNPGTLYIMSTLRRWLASAGTLLALALRPPRMQHDVQMEV